MKKKESFKKNHELSYIWYNENTARDGTHNLNILIIQWNWARIWKSHFFGLDLNSVRGLGGLHIKGEKWAWSLITSFFHNNFSTYIFNFKKKSTFWKEKKKRQCEKFSFWPKHFTGTYFFLKQNQPTNQPFQENEIHRSIDTNNYLLTHRYTCLSIQKNNISTI